MQAWHIARETATLRRLREKRKTNFGVHTPRAVEEDPLLRRHRLMWAQQVLEHGCAHTLRMSPLGDLGELRRLAEQDQLLHFLRPRSAVTR